MAYLRLRDYLQYIQTDNLNQVISSDSSIRTIGEAAGQAEMISYLIQKYLTDDEFRDTVVFSMAKKYKAKQLIELNFATWSSVTAYVLNDLIVKNGKAFISISASTNKDPETEPTFWTQIGNQYDLFYIPTPYDEFDYTKVYKIGDFVWWKDSVYKCLIPTALIDHETALQSGTYSNLPLLNIFPDDPIEGVRSWGVGKAYSFTGLSVIKTFADFTVWSNVTAYITGNRVSYLEQIWEAQAGSTGVTPGTDITKWLPISWTKGDNRSQQMIMYLIDVVLYHIHSRIAPRNIPQLRIDRYDSAIAWLKMAGKGEITADLPLIQPKSGRRIRFGGVIKNINTY